MGCKRTGHASRLLLAAGCWGALCTALFAQARPRDGAAQSNSLAAPKFSLAHTLSGHERCVYTVAFSPDGSLLATGSWDGTAKLWDVATGHQVRTLGPRSMAITSLAFSPDGRVLWNVATAKAEHTLAGHTRAVLCLAFSPDGQQLASGSRDASIRFWEIPSGKPLHTITVGPSTGAQHVNVCSLSFSADGRRLASGATGGTMKMFDPASGDCTCTISIGNTHPYVRPLAMHGAGRWLVAGGSAPVVLFWDAITGKKLGELSGHSAAVEAVAISPDGRWLASGSSDHTAKLWRLDDH